MQGMSAGLTKYSCFDCINEDQHLERETGMEMEMEQALQRCPVADSPSSARI